MSDGTKLPRCLCRTNDQYQVERCVRRSGGNHLGSSEYVAQYHVPLFPSIYIHFQCVLLRISSLFDTTQIHLNNVILNTVLSLARFATLVSARLPHSWPYQCCKFLPLHLHSILSNSYSQRSSSYAICCSRLLTSQPRTRYCPRHL